MFLPSFHGIGHCSLFLSFFTFPFLLLITITTILFRLRLFEPIRRQERFRPWKANINESTDPARNSFRRSFLRKRRLRALLMTTVHFLFPIFIFYFIFFILFIILCFLPSFYGFGHCSPFLFFTFIFFEFSPSFSHGFLHTLRKRRSLARLSC